MVLRIGGTTRMSLTPKQLLVTVVATVEVPAATVGTIDRAVVEYLAVAAVPAVEAALRAPFDTAEIDLAASGVVIDVDTNIMGGVSSGATA